MKTNKLRLIALALNAALTLTTVIHLSAAEAPAKAASAATNAPVKLGVKQLLEDPSDYVGKKIELQGFVTDYCKRKGCWAVLHDEDADAKQQLRVKQNEEGDTFKPFLPELQGKTISAFGEVHETKIDADYLDKWEARVKSAKEKGAATKEKGEEDDSSKAVLKQIAGFRERIAKSKKGYLTSISFAVDKWEARPESK